MFTPSRRDLLAVAAAGLPAMAAIPASRKMRISLSPGAIGVKGSLPEAIEMAARHGFEAVEPSAAFLAKLSDDDLRRLLDQMKSKDLAWGVAGVPVNLGDANDAYAESLKALPAFAKTLGRARLTRASRWLAPTHDALTYRANFDIHAKRLGEVAAILNDHGARFGLEYVGPKTSWSAKRYPFIHSMAETKELIAASGAKNVGFVLDSWHWYTALETPADLATLKNADVVSVDLNDAPAGVPVDQQMDQKRELPAATGVIDVAAFLRALVKMGFDGPVRAEPFNAALRAMTAEQALATTSAAMKKAFASIGG